MEAPASVTDTKMGGQEVLRRQQRLRRQHAVLEHQEFFDQILQESVGALLVGSRAEAFGAQTDLVTEMLLTTLTRDFHRRIDRFTHQSLGEAWQRFDTNKDGALQQRDMRSLVQHLLAGLKASVPALVEASKPSALEKLRLWIESDVAGTSGYGGGQSGLHMALERSLRESLDLAGTKLACLLEAVLDRMSTKSDAISDQLFEEIDLHKDGLVTQEEFSEGFAEAFAAVVDFDRVVATVLRERASREAEQPETLVRAGTALLVLGGVAAFVALLLRCGRHPRW